MLGLGLVFCLIGSTGPALADPAGMQQLKGALAQGRAEGLVVTWTLGLIGTEKQRLVIREGLAQVAHCPAASCTDAGAASRLTAGQRDRLLSGLRAAGLSSLRGAGPGQIASVDRELRVKAGGNQAGQWSLPRAEWPAPPGGDSEGLAAFLDGLYRDLSSAASARHPVPVPRSPADLLELTLKLRLVPRTRPGGVVLIEHGVVSVTPEEGTLPRVPVPVPWQRPLSTEEQARLIEALGAADLYQLEGQVPRREAPAIGDEDGRLATLHLLPLPGGRMESFQPWGCRRFLQDLLRSPAAPLAEQLVALLTPPARLLPPPPKGRSRSAAVLPSDGSLAEGRR